MTLRTPRHRRIALLCALSLAACTPAAVKNAAPPIETLGGKAAPDPNILPIIKSEPVAISPEAAAENYREILKLAPDDDTKRESKRRLADLQVQIEDGKGNDQNSEKAIRESIKLYNELLYANPDAKDNDRIFFQLARAYQNVGDAEAAIETLERLTKRHADSELTGDAHFRRAELLFAVKRYAEAETEYKVVMDLADKTPFFEPSQRKFGWARFKQGNYEGALEVFLVILDRELPRDGELFDPKTVLDRVDPKRSDLARESLRVTSLSLAALGGGKATSDYLKAKGDPRFYPLIYNALGDLLLEKQRWTDAADSFAAFVERYPGNQYAPDFQSRVIGAYADGGFNDLVLREKERYATTYDPAAPYWQGGAVRPDVLKELRKHFDDLGKHYFAKAQAGGKLEPAPGQAPEEIHYKDHDNFLTAARWYKRIIEVYPNDVQLAQSNFMLGESLLYGGKTLEGADQLTHTAFDLGQHNRVSEAAYGAVLAYQQNAREVAKDKRPDALRLAIAASLRLADKLPGHPETYRVLTRSSEDLYELKDYEQVVVVAARVLKAPVVVDAQLRRVAWSVTADSQFALKKYPEAETAYGEELRLTPKNSPAYTDTTEQLAASIYKQGEAARDAGDLRKAATQFLRVGQVTPSAKIRATADYDGATMLIKLEDWPAAETVLENFRRLYPGHALEADVDKKLAVAYQKDNKPVQAAQVFFRIAQRPSESADTRREAGWFAATLFDQGKDSAGAARAYEFYIGSFPRPLARAMDARQRLADMARDRGDAAGRTRWLREIMIADDTAGAERSDRSKIMAATAAIELARNAAAEVKQIALSAPLEKSLPRKKQAMELATQALSRAANYGYAEITTAATYELGLIYQDFAKALMESERPRKLKELELEQYNALLEEQSFPFEQKAIQTYETNLKRISQGIYDEWVQKSARALALMAPAKYGKREKGEDIYATLK